VVAGVGAVVAAGDAVDGVGAVVALCPAVVDCPALLTAGVGFDEPLEPLHADANNAVASAATAIVDLLPIIHSFSHGR
jgi:hypothetical protein